MPTVTHEFKKRLALTALSACILSPAACVRVENGTLFMSEAQRPVGWPEITPVGKVELKDRPAHVRGRILQSPGGEGRLFGTLFRHIQARDIPMTAPVTMTRSSGGQMQSMGFLYENLEVGSVGTAGDTEVQDRLGHCGVHRFAWWYSKSSYANGLTLLQKYLQERDHLQPIGEPMYMGYNSPFVPGF